MPSIRVYVPPASTKLMPKPVRQKLSDLWRNLLSEELHEPVEGIETMYIKLWDAYNVLPVTLDILYSFEAGDLSQYEVEEVLRERIPMLRAKLLIWTVTSGILPPDTEVGMWNVIFHVAFWDQETCRKIVVSDEQTLSDLARIRRISMVPAPTAPAS